MTAFSYSNWSSMDAEAQKDYPGISIERQSIVNNPDRGVYWSATTSAAALSKHIESTLAGEDKIAATRMWNTLRGLHRQATQSPRVTDRALAKRQVDAHRALGAYHGDLNNEQLEQLVSVTDDVITIQKVADTHGVDPILASTMLMDRAASRAIGFEMTDDRIDPRLRPVSQDPAGASAITNLNQSVRQLQSLVKDMDLDALDQVAIIGRDGDYTDELREDHQRLNDILKSIPLLLNPSEIEPETNFSVRMETQEEATVIETVVRWAGETKELPDANDVHKTFSSWRDVGISASPFERDRVDALGIVSSNTDAARENLSALLEGVNNGDKTKDTPVIILVSQPDQRFLDMLAKTGRPVIITKAEADLRGPRLDTEDKAGLPLNRIELVALTAEQAANSVERSLAVNAVVGRSVALGHVAGGSQMSPMEAQAIHIAGSNRKLNVGVAADGQSLSFKELTELRSMARHIDSTVDAQRYYTAGHARPYEGISATAFDGARHFDKANEKNAPGRDLIAEAYASIPKKNTILTVDQDQNAVVKWMEKNATERTVLYAEAKRVLSFAEIVGVGLEGERRVARESGMEVAIYDRPAASREYEIHQRGDRNVKVCTTPEIAWDDPRVRGAIVLVSGNAGERALNTPAQAVKVAQEAVMDRAHGAMIVNDFGKDYHAAHMILLADEMGKRTTIIDSTGKEVGLAEARERTRQHAQTFSELREIELGQKTRVSEGHPSNRMVDVAVSSDLGQKALSGLPGMDAASAVRFAHLDNTLQEIRTDKSDEMRKLLIDNGMPARTRKIINDLTPWVKTVDRALENETAARSINAQFHVPTDKEHPIEMSSGGLVKHAVYTVGGYDYEKRPLAAMIGSSTPVNDAGINQNEGTRPAYIDPADIIDRKTLRATIDQMTRNGYGILTTMEEGVSRAVLEEAAHVRDAKVVVIAPGNMQAASPKVRAAVMTLLEQNRVGVVMPSDIAPMAAEDTRPGEDRRPDRYLENRAAMHDMVAKAAKVAIVIACPQTDQSMHIVKHMIELDKPVAAMVPQDPSNAGSDLYSANMSLLRGRNKAAIQSIGMAQGVSAQGYAELDDKETEVKLDNGVMRGNAGTFKSARLAKSEMLRSGHMHQSFGWQTAARPISSEASVDRFLVAVEEGKGKLGAYVELSEREKEKSRLAREENGLSQFTKEQFAGYSALHRTAIMQDAGRSAGY